MERVHGNCAIFVWRYQTQECRNDELCLLRRSRHSCARLYRLWVVLCGAAFLADLTKKDSMFSNKRRYDIPRCAEWCVRLRNIARSSVVTPMFFFCFFLIILVCCWCLSFTDGDFLRIFQAQTERASMGIFWQAVVREHDIFPSKYSVARRSDCCVLRPRCGKRKRLKSTNGVEHMRVVLRW